MVVKDARRQSYGVKLGNVFRKSTNVFAPSAPDGPEPVAQICLLR
jgi:hypothetical protein